MRSAPRGALAYMESFVERVKQYPGLQQVMRKVKVDVPGKHFSGLQAAEQKKMYSGTAVEYAERHSFDRHLKAWGAAHTGLGIRFLCESDAIDDPDHKGFWAKVCFILLRKTYRDILSSVH